ncbi:MAG: hypothetical protein OWV35_11445, partial [Firmicutes bacterium]|nr:hypothetical protein [Bacillota bacterium]
GARSSPPGLGAPGGRLYRTTDGGRTWQLVATPFHPLAVAFRSGTDGWAAGRHALWQTHDGGRHWTAAYRYAGSEVPWTVHLAPGGTGQMWALLAGGSGMNQTSYTVLRYAPGQGWRVAAAVSTAGAGPAPEAPAGAPAGPGSSPGPLAVTASGTVFLAGECRACGFGTVQVWRSGPGGSGWTAYPPVYGAAGIPGPHALSFINARQGWLLDGVQGVQLLATRDGGRTWRQVFPAPAVPVRGVSFPSPGRGYGLGWPGEPDAVLVSTDGGRRWMVQGRIPAGSASRWEYLMPALVFPAPDRGWAVRDNRLWHTADGGRHWQAVTLPGDTPRHPLTQVAFVGAEGVAGSPISRTLWWTANGGRTWNEARHADFNATLGELSPAEHAEAARLGNLAVMDAGSGGGGVLWLLFNDQQWAWSGNGGAGWVVRRFPAAVEEHGGAASLSFATPQDGWLETGSGLLFRTRDGGAVWTPVAGG